MWASTGLSGKAILAWYLASAAWGALAFEMGRKIDFPRKRSTEYPRIPKPTAGARRGWPVAIASLSHACTWPLVDQRATRQALAGALLPGWSRRVRDGPQAGGAKAVEGACTALLLIVFLAPGHLMVISQEEVAAGAPVERVGGKAAGLGRLLAAECLVPPFLSYPLNGTLTPNKTLFMPLTNGGSPCGSAAAEDGATARSRDNSTRSWALVI